MFDEKNRYVIEEYQKKSPFSSFLPGIAGELGVPVWCYYNNRGQGVCSFGVDDKDHAIMEFSPARQAYRDVARTGFRTFCKVDGGYRELFTGGSDMHIGMSELELTCKQDGLEASAVYFGVPGERAAALARILTVRNAADRPVGLVLLDGMPELVPYGVSHENLKEMNNLAQAWMRVEYTDQGAACFQVRASMEDSAQVTAVEGCNFCLAWDEAGTSLRPITQPELVFGTDTSLGMAEGFAAAPLAELCAAPQQTENRFPCCFLPKAAALQPGQAVTVFSLYGQAEDRGRIAALAGKITGGDWFEEKRRQAAELVEQLCAPASCRTADPVFDAYCQQTWLDNLLRGGAPTFFEAGGKSVPFYLYSRKHGDPEREYNAFSLGSSYYAQGNGNFRDVNQNRRSDVLFSPGVGAANIHTFYDLIQTDGYNPLVLTAGTYTLPQEARERFLTRFPGLKDVLTGPFTPGALAMALEDQCLDVQGLTAAIVCAADSEPNADFKEGYWCDHWTYNLDLIENYLSVYPEQEEALLFGQRRYRWYESRAVVKPRAKRYHRTKNGLRQYDALDEAVKGEVTRKWTLAGKEEAVSTLMEKLLLLCAVKTATLDAAGMGIEMEGGKPGWYDALNGLPGLLGSSMAESCELARLLAFTRRALERQPGQVELYEEIAELVEQVAEVLAGERDAFARWDKLNTVKERYRAGTDFGLSGVRRSVDREDLAELLGVMEEAVRAGIRAAVALGGRLGQGGRLGLGGGICPTYFTFTADALVDTPDGPMPTGLTPHVLPLFLEGPVHWLKLDAPQAEKAALERRVRESGLYDRELRMYKVNESLAGVSYEAGRAVAFSPGWLENESVWLHMEYKYLLELLKSGLYEAFAQAFHAAAVPFLDPARYGRSPLENVSFLASSANPDPARWGQGFVARLSGSTAEFLQMWQLMFFGPKPFYLEGGELRLTFRPFIPAYLMPADGVVRATFLGGIPVTYSAPGCAALEPGKTAPERWTLTTAGGETVTVDGPYLPDREARMVRDGKITELQITMK